MCSSDLNRTGSNRIIMDDPLASAERTALMVGLVITMGLILVLVIACTMLFISNKTERDVNEILKQKILRRMIQCE